MSDSAINRFLASGPMADRLAFVPDPPTVATGADCGYLWWDTDLQAEYAYDFGTAAWVAVAGGGAGTVTNTGTLTDHALIVGNGGVDVSALASLGTTTTVLHGNAAGDPTFGAVSLTADVTGDLPFANLTQIAGLSVLGVAGSSTADVAAITAATDGDVLQRVSSSSVAFAALPGVLLAYTAYNPATSANTSTSSSTFADVDATNLTITFTVPSSGRVLVRLTAVAATNNAATVYAWNLRTTGGSNVTGTSTVVSSNTNQMRSSAAVVVTGLTPGASQTYRWGHAASSNTGFIRYGDDGTTTARYGPAMMEVWSAP